MSRVYRRSKKVSSNNKRNWKCTSANSVLRVHVQPNEISRFVGAEESAAPKMSKSSSNSLRSDKRAYSSGDGRISTQDAVGIEVELRMIYNDIRSNANF
jgi:hypothetical protein